MAIIWNMPIGYSKGMPEEYISMIYQEVMICEYLISIRKSGPVYCSS